MRDANEVGDESLRSDAAVSHGKRCTGSPGQDALAEGSSLPGLQSRQVLADRIHQQDWRPATFVSVRFLQVQFSATTGTLFHDSHLPLTKWFAAVSLMSAAQKGISASQLGRHMGLTYKTAWYVAHRIREAMREAKDMQLGDPDTTVEIDEDRRRPSPSRFQAGPSI